MALLQIDGFDYYGSAQLASKGWSGNGLSLQGASYTRFDVGQCLECGADWYQTKTLPFNVGPQAYVGMAMNLSVVQEGNLLWFKDESTSQVQITLSTNGNVVVNYNGGSQQASYIPTAGVWNYWEVGITFGSGTSGSVTVRVNGSPIITVTGVDTIGSGNAYFNDIIFGDNGVSQSYIDDFYICDGSGSAYNTFLGDVRVYGLLPAGAGSSTQWTPNGAASNYECMNQVPPNASDYVSSSTPGQVDLYTMQTVPAAAQIIGVQVSYYAQKTDSGTRTLQSVVKSGSVQAEGAENNLGTSPQYFQDVFYNDPNTGAAWTLAAVNAMQVGINEVA